MEHESESPELPADDSSASTAIARRDGWTPFARRLFLEVLAETGRVNRACDYAGLSVTSAYALRHRDAAFAAGWDAACELARTALADALYERALDGTTETLTRNGEVIAERHRHDSRLSIAVLHRLDRRCDRAREQGARHIVLIEHWEEWLSLVGKGADEDASALLESARSGSSPQLQLPQLPLGGNPTADDEEEDHGLDLSDRCWKSDEAFGELVWMTDFPPPDGFDGYESGAYGSSSYERECTPEEIAALDADETAADAALRADDAELRDEWFKLLKQDLESADGNDANRHAELGSASIAGTNGAGGEMDPETSSG